MGMQPISRISALAALAFAAGCGGSSEQNLSGGEVSRSWKPTELSEVEGVPIAEVRSEIGKLLECRVIPVELVDPYYYHLDTCFCPLAPGVAAWDPAGFVE